MQRLQNDKSNLDFWSILSAFWSFHDLWHHRNNICSVNKSHWYFAPCCSTLVQKIFWDTLCETGWKLTQFQTGKPEVAQDHHHQKWTPFSKSPKICCQMWKLSSHDSKWQRPLCEPKISEETNMSVYFYHHRKSWSSPSELTHNTMIMMMITVRSLYLMARQQNSLAVNPALAVTFVLGKWEWMSPNRESFF